MSSAALSRTLRVSASRSIQRAGRRHASHGHGPQYNEPSGYLFSEKPLPAGQKRVKEPWERIWYWGVYGSLGIGAVLLYYKPDTSIQTWALKEAKARMEARGEKTDYP
ncbi:hypothetical protein EUX98_g4108 [Antrodiella citrinella]|uniref:NADH dehydrogenase [ubiquinone] 1 beta subcomplex subunit 11, mitochondrial n=1 Tax=Antrodiella citrinella TaxID=2447956 RepID=A0A4S4MUU1_9APHY|nr:hypothetical protein EUX98_g4108 [Antrodiella citrinella]